jgi:uncharacterized protein YfaS (alpha-2-macroglobulin family)
MAWRRDLWAGVALFTLWMASQSATVAWDSADTPPSRTLQVSRVIPEGVDVPPGRQLVVTFDRPVVPLGDMFLDPARAPVVIEPAPRCHWHWIDPRSIACELDSADALLPGTEYRVTVRAGLTAEDGTRLESPYRWTFSTERPAIRFYTFHNWRSPGTPVVRLIFNQPVTRDSVEANLRFSGQARVDAEPDPWLYDAHGSQVEARRVWLVSPPQELPADLHAELHVQPGLRGYSGPLPGTEDRTVVEFDTFPPFRFLGIRCRVGTAAALIPPAEADDGVKRCDPLARVALAFTAPVTAAELHAHLKVTPDLTGGREDYDPWANDVSTSRLCAPHSRGQEYDTALPEHLKAFRDYEIDGLAAVADEFGRLPDGATAIHFMTDHRPPRLRLSHPVAVLENNAPTAMPLYVTNLTDLEIRYRRLTPFGATADLRATQAIAPAWDIAYAVPAKVRDLLGGQSGVVSGSITPHPAPPTVDDGGYFDDDEGEADLSTLRGRSERPFFAEVTPYAVHAKLGHYNTLIWVTSLASGKPVSAASVQVYEDSYESLSKPAAALAQARTGPDGVAMLPGRAVLDPTGKISEFGGRSAMKLMVRVDAGDGMALLPLDGNFLIDTYRASRGAFWSSPMPRESHVRAWGTTAQGVYKLGDTIQFKLYVRKETNRTLAAMPQRRGYRLQIDDPTGKAVYEAKDLELSEFGAYAGEFRVPPTAAVGWYEFRLTCPVGWAMSSEALSSGLQEGSNASKVLLPMRVLVADFTPAPFHTETTLNGAIFEPGDPVEASTRATLHAGGPYADAAARVTARIWPETIAAKSPIAAGFAFDDIASSECRGRFPPDAAMIHQSEGHVNERGELTTRFTVPPGDIIYGRMEVESAVRDERGKYVASRAPAEFRGRDRYVGLRSSQWTLEEGKPASVQFLVIDKAGTIVSGVPVTISVSGEVVKAARVKGAGNAYLTSYSTEWKEGETCARQSAAEPGTCTFTPGAPGLISIRAVIKDTHGQEHATELCAWVTGKGRVLWQEPEDMSLTLVPEKISYKVGDRARYLVRNPFPDAEALISIERFGVIKSWVQTLKGSTPIIDFPIEADYLPGFYLSVVVMSPRVAQVPASGMPQEAGVATPEAGRAAQDAPGAPQEAGVDLGRPTYRIGYVEVAVADPAKSLDVSIRTDREEYKPRETVKLQVGARPHMPGAAPEPVEFAVAVLDTGVFDLIRDGKAYFDPYRGFYQMQSLDLVNFDLLSRLVGLQKFEKKGATAGGDGGAGFDIRSVSKYLAYWNPSVRADEQGKASLEFTLPDNLTGWRVLAIAVTPGDHLGLGDGQFKTSKLTEIRPVMPNQVIEGDRFTAGFSVLNRANVARTIAVEVTAQGELEGPVRKIQTSVRLEPFKRDVVWFPLQSRHEGTIALTATAADDSDRDALEYAVPVQRRLSLDVAASYGTTLKARVNEAVAFPAGMEPGIGRLSVVLSPTVIGNVDGAFRYVRDYPYECWEQRLTKALLAATYLRLHAYLPLDLQWPEAQSLPQATLDAAASFQAPDGGMAFWVPQDDRVSPYLSAATAAGFNELRSAGYRVPEGVDSRLRGYLERFLRDKAAPTFYSEGMVSSVRAVALEALAGQALAGQAPGGQEHAAGEEHAGGEAIGLEDLLRYRDYAPGMDLFGLSAYLRAAVEVKGGDELAADITRRILAHASESGGKFAFTEVWDDGYAQMLATPLRTQCAVLRALLAYGETKAGSALTGDVPFKLVRSITAARGNRLHWENTQENLYCLEALSDYSRVYEEQRLSLSAAVSLDDQPLGTAVFSTFRDPPAELVRANRPDDAGRKATLTIARQGEGRVYYAARLSYAQSGAAATETNAGIEVRREYSVKRDGRWQLLADPIRIARGEVVRVDLYVSLPVARHFVVVDDAVPGGLEPVNRDLATASGVDADSAEFQAAGGAFWFRYADWSYYGTSLWSFYHRELKHDSARFYADYLAAGHYHLSYAAQAIAAGRFAAPATRAEEMYDPDIYGKGMPGQLQVDD